MCGVAAAIDLEGTHDVVPLAVQLINDLQNRGQLGAGLTWKRSKKIRGDILGVFKRCGLVSEVLTPANIRNVYAESPVAMAHVRYATDGVEDDELCHPRHYKAKENQPEFTIGFNGNFPDYKEHLARLKHAGISPRVGGDTEIMGQTIALALAERQEGMRAAMTAALGSFDGACNAIVLSEKGKLYATRDPQGFHPLAYAQNDQIVAIASEDRALRALWPDVDVKVHNVKPGEILRVSPNSGISIQQAWEPKIRQCFFERVYFADHRTRIDGKAVANTRYASGKILAERDSNRPITDIVVPVPETAKIAANGYADTRRLRRIDAILRKEGARRTFIESGDRLDKLKKKFDIDPNFLAGQTIILVDDSLVRGSTMKDLIILLREAGVAEVHVRLASPPILAPCFYGIDMKTIKELKVREFFDGPLQEFDTLPDEVLRQLAVAIGADSISFLPISAVSKTMGMPHDQICMACVTGEYPTPAGERLYQLAEAAHSH